MERIQTIFHSTFWGSNTLQFCFCAITERKVDIFPTHHWAQSFIYTKKKEKKKENGGK